MQVLKSYLGVYCTISLRDFFFNFDLCPNLQFENAMFIFKTTFSKLTAQILKDFRLIQYHDIFGLARHTTTPYYLTNVMWAGLNARNILHRLLPISATRGQD